jgi:hypothetical protein
MHIGLDGQEPVRAVALPHWTDVRVPIRDVGASWELTLAVESGPVEVDYIVVY